MAEGELGTVYAHSAATGELVRRVEVPGAVFLNDLVVTRNAVWVNDSSVDRLAPRPAAGGLWQGALRGDTLSVPSTATRNGRWLWAVNARFGAVPDPAAAEYYVTRLAARP